jgi:biopolymer transport protein ExbB/TolQ
MAYSAPPGRRWGSLVAFVGGLGLAAAFLTLIRQQLPADSLLVRYCCGHPVEYVEVLLFFVGLTVLAGKFLAQARERRALGREALPAAEGPQPAASAESLLGILEAQPRRWQASLVGRRLRAGLEFVRQRGSADGLDDHLRNLTDADADALDGSHSLIRFITWAIPILGFLGTVLGITDAIANVTPEQLAESITGVTSGLAVAFDTTALALACAIPLMFFTFVVDRLEQGVLEGVNAAAERQLAHRFRRDDGPYTEALRPAAQAVQRLAEDLVRRQAELWAKSLEAQERRWEQARREQQDQLAAAVGRLLDAALEAQHQRLAAADKEHQARTGQLLHHFDRLGGQLKELTAVLQAEHRRAAEQAPLVGQLLEAEHNVLRLQDTLNQNLQALAQVGTFQQAIHNLNAAIQLLTARALSWGSGPAAPRPAAGAATGRAGTGNAA